ncbi:MAG: sigma-54 dependent transcriptional regulator [Gemmatimonadota bacterium]|nr:sigma-54 dependent transcriptional regulator [Gemmatimonadota bacterium]
MNFGIPNIVGQSPGLGQAIELARKVAASRLTSVLIVGETGSGKELVARGIHYAGASHGEPFVTVNCGLVPEGMLESELFGHEGDALTNGGGPKRGLVELAAGGTLFLDEIGDLPHRLQPTLLRALEARVIRRVGGRDEIRVNCRVIASTNASLPDAVNRLEFREDLYYRLNVFRIALPPLRERGDDVLRLAMHFLSTIAQEQGLAPKTLRPDAIAALRGHSWPGNVRELKNVMEHATILSEGNGIGAEHLMIQHRTSLPVVGRMGPLGGEIRIPPGGKSLANIEREAVALTLQLTRGNRSAAARTLGISRPTLARKMRDFGLAPPSAVSSAA